LADGRIATAGIDRDDAIRTISAPSGRFWQTGGRRTNRMRAIGIVGEIGDDRQIRAEAPRGLRPGRVQLIVVQPDEDESGALWPLGVSQAWSDDLGDARQDIYTLADGQPIDLSR
jgi:hypothetical protein